MFDDCDLEKSKLLSLPNRNDGEEENQFQKVEKDHRPFDKRDDERREQQEVYEEEDDNNGVEFS